ncbi:hypothetical protein IJJ27_02585, partial [bacterium]|nr:hypothetical protein [bacterium]
EPKVNEENENDLAISSDEVGELDAEPEMEESQIEVTGDESALEVIDFESWHPDTDDDNTEVEKKNDLEGLLAGHQKFADLLTLTAQFRTIGDDLERTRKKAA